MLPKHLAIVPIRRLLINFGILKLGKSVKPGIANFSLHRHSKRRNNRRENILVHVKNELDIEFLGGLLIYDIIGKSHSVRLVNGKRRERVVSRFCTVRALYVVIGKFLCRNLYVVCELLDLFIHVLKLLLVIGEHEAALHVHHFDVGDCFVGIRGCGINKINFIV